MEDAEERVDGEQDRERRQHHVAPRPARVAHALPPVSTEYDDDQCGSDGQSEQALHGSSPFGTRPRCFIRVVEFARHRQGVVVALGVGLVILILAGLHEYVTRRNARDAFPLRSGVDPFIIRAPCRRRPRQRPHDGDHFHVLPVHIRLNTVPEPRLNRV